jgi:arylsulfatase A-like enzyme
VLILSGPGIASGGAEIARANVIDITPTLLALLGLPVAEDMHGRPLIEASSDGTASEVSQIESWEAVGLSPTRSGRDQPDSIGRRRS